MTLIGVLGIQNQWSGACSVQSQSLGQKLVAVSGGSPVEPAPGALQPVDQTG